MYTHARGRSALHRELENIELYPDFVSASAS